MVLRWHHSRKEYVFQWRDWPLWENAAIGRKLGVEGASAVVEELIRTGHAEWNDAGKSMVTLMWHSAEEIAAKLFDFVRKHDMVGSVFTVYELHQGDDVLGTVRNYYRARVGASRRLPVFEGFAAAPNNNQWVSGGAWCEGCLQLSPFMMDVNLYGYSQWDRTHVHPRWYPGVEPHQR